MKSIKQKTDYTGYNQVLLHVRACAKCECEKCVSVYSEKPFTLSDVQKYDADDGRFIHECKNCGLIDPHLAV